jgi:hypothetical protein
MTEGDLGSRFKAAQFHFHWGNDNTRGSEHTYNGKTYPAEVRIPTTLRCVFHQIYTNAHIILVQGMVRLLEKTSFVQKPIK